MTRLGVLTVDTALAVRTWDEWIAASTGIPAAEACGRPLAELVPSLVERGLLARFEQVLATGEVQVLAPAFHSYLLPCPPHDPSANFDRMQQRVTLGPLRDGESIVGVIATVEDVTARLDRERELAQRLRAGDWRTRRSAVEELARQTDGDTVVSLVSALKEDHRDLSLLSSALKLLSTVDVDVTRHLAELLQDSDADLRIQAALALGEHHTPEAIEPLTRALVDPDVNVRYHAIEALGRLRAADAVDALAEIAAGDDFFLAFPAVDALARIADARVASKLVPLLESPRIGEAVADALAELGGAEDVRPLVEALNAGAPAVPIARAIARIYGRCEQQFGGGALIVEAFQTTIGTGGAQGLLGAVTGAPVGDLRALVMLLGWLRGPAVERALTRLLGTAALRDEVMEAIVRQDVGIIDLLVEQLRAEDADTRLAAILALGRTGSRRAAPAVAEMLHGKPAEAVAAAGSLARIGDPAAYEALMPLLAHEDAAVRQAAIGALNALGHPDMSRRVVAALDSPDPRERESAIRIAGYFGYPEAIDAILARCDDPVEPVRRAAVEHLPYLEDPRAAARLAAAGRDASAKVRAGAVQALGRMSASEAMRPLLDATRDEDAWVRYFAARALAEFGDACAVPPLMELATGDPAMHVRIAALEAVGACDGPTAVDALLPVASDRDAELAAAALRSLGRASDPRAEQALREALRSEDAAIRLAAVTGFGAGSSAGAIDALAWTAAADLDDAVAVAAVEALGALARRADEPGATAVDALVAIAAEPRLRDSTVAALAGVPEARIPRVAAGLAHAQPEVRRATIGALSRLKHPDASAAIRDALDDGDASVREAAVMSLDRLGTRGVGGKLAALAQSDPARAVRRAASAALARRADGGTR